MIIQDLSYNAYMGQLTDCICLSGLSVMQSCFLTILILLHFADKASCCGVPDAQFPIKTPAESNQRIWGGAEARPNSLPWQVLLLTRKDLPGGEREQSLCGGTIISPYWVVTAAHCVHDRYVHRIVAGWHNIEAYSPTRQVRTKATIFQHPDYNPVDNYHKYDNDIALLLLDERFEFNSYVQRVCTTRKAAPKGLNCLTSGWGLTDTGNRSPVLRQAYMQIVDAFQCLIRYVWFNPDSMICAWDKGQSNIGSCQGDSGGPLVCKSWTGEWYLFGVTNVGPSCAEETDKFKVPMVFANVPKYINWIQEHMTTHTVSLRMKMANTTTTTTPTTTPITSTTTTMTPVVMQRDAVFSSSNQHPGSERNRPTATTITVESKTAKVYGEETRYNSMLATVIGITVLVIVVAIAMAIMYVKYTQKAASDDSAILLKSPTPKAEA